MLLPMKSRILEYAIKQDRGITVEDAMSVLEPDYGKERMFNRKLVEEYFDAFVGVTFMKASDLAMDGDDLKITYEMTDYGRSRGKYLTR
jgi:hypothetical protein